MFAEISGVLGDLKIQGIGFAIAFTIEIAPCIVALAIAIKLLQVMLFS